MCATIGCVCDTAQCKFTRLYLRLSIRKRTEPCMGVHSPYINRGTPQENRTVKYTIRANSLRPCIHFRCILYTCKCCFLFLSTHYRTQFRKRCCWRWIVCCCCASLIVCWGSLYSLFALVTKMFSFFYLFKTEATRAFHVKVTVSCPVCVHNIYFKALCGVLISR
jgi:hypothetical protein